MSLPRKKAKLTNKSVKQFLKSANVGQRLYDTEVAGLFIRKLKTNGYFYYYYKTSLGKKKEASIGRYTENTCEQARAIAKQFAGRVTTGEDLQETKLAQKIENNKTPRAYLNSEYQTVQSRKKRGRHTLRDIETFFAEWLDKPISEFEPKDVIRWQAEQEATGVKYTTLVRRYNTFRTMINHAVEKQFFENNPLSSIKLEKYHETEEQKTLRKSRRNYLTASQTRSFFNAIETYQEENRPKLLKASTRDGKATKSDKIKFVDHVKPIFYLLFYSGFRTSDAFTLRWENVNFDFQTISKVISKTEHKCPHEKHFPISMPLLDVLRAWWRQNGSPDKGLVFPSPVTGKAFCPTALKKPWAKIRKIANLPDNMQLYSLRHNFASHLIMKGCDLLSVAKLLGHSDIDMLVRHYGHLQPNLLKDYTNQFADLINKSINEHTINQLHGEQI